MKTLSRHTHIRHTGVKASSRPRKRRRIEEPELVQTEMTSELGKTAMENARIASLYSQGDAHVELKNTPRKDKGAARDKFGSDQTAHADSSDNLKLIEKEFSSNFAACSIDEFLEKYIPFQRVPMPAGGRLARTFDRVKEAKKEDNMYRHFEQGLQRLVASFPVDKRIVSFTTANTKFPSLDMAHHYTKPDIASAPPGKGKPLAWSWHNTALAWELKLHATDDPVDREGSCKKGDEHTKTLAQLYKVARNLFMAHLSCFVFVVGVYGPTMRFYRFDHSGIIGSNAFDYTKSPKHVRRFLWQLAHPRPYNGLSASPGTIVGADPTLVKPSDEDFELYFARLIKKCPELATEREGIRNKARLIDAGLDVEDCGELRVLIESVPSNHYNQQDGSTVCPIKCFAFEVLHNATSVVGRATHVFKILILGKNESEDRICTLKDAWQQRTRDHEGQMYKRVKMAAKHEKVRARLMTSPILQLDMEAPDAMAKTGLANHVGTFNMAYCREADIFGLVTQSARLHVRNNPDVGPGVELPQFDRNRIRSIMTNIGRPLTAFRCTMELIKATQEAVKGLEFLRLCGLLHRDVSAGNILLNDTKEITGGFLHDLDYSARILCAADDSDSQMVESIQKNLKDMTGTRPFMAMGILKFSQEDHAPHHDLESIFWVMIWCILRHTQYIGKPGACAELFDRGNIASNKQGFFNQDPPLAVQDNPPLSDLVQELIDKFDQHTPHTQKLYAKKGESVKLVDAEALFQTLEQALKRDDWPEDDKSLPYDRTKVSKAEDDAKKASKARSGIVAPATGEKPMRQTSKRKSGTSKPSSSKTAKTSRNSTPGDTQWQTWRSGLRDYPQIEKTSVLPFPIRYFQSVRFYSSSSGQSCGHRSLQRGM